MGLSTEQTNRILEEIQSLALGCRHMKDLLNTDVINKPALESGADLMENLLDQLSNDIVGMMDGEKCGKQS